MMTRRFALLGATLALTAATAIASQNIFSYLRADVKKDDIVLSWRSVNETGIQYYDVERRSDEVPEFRRLDRIGARGNGNTYSFTDNGAFFKPSAGQRFSYRVRAVGSAGEQYSPITSVVHEVSSVKRSWGMIKELFR